MQAAMMQGRDDWDTDPDFVNDVSEKESRWGSKTVEGSGLQGGINLERVRQDTIMGDTERKKRMHSPSSQPSHGYGGRFGVMKDRMDKSAESWNYKGATEKHPSQVDYAYGFGGRFGVQTDRQDKCALGWDYREKLAIHPSQKGPKVDIKGNISHDWLSSNPDAINGRKPPPATPAWKSEVEAVKHRRQLLEGAAQQQRNPDSIASSENSDERQEALKNELRLCKASSLKEKFEKMAIKDVTPQVDRPRPGKLPAWNAQRDASFPSDADTVNRSGVNPSEHVQDKKTSEYEQQDNLIRESINATNGEDNEDWPTDEPDASDDAEACRWEPAAVVYNDEYGVDAEGNDDFERVAIEDHPLSDAVEESAGNHKREFSGGDDKLQPVDSHPLGEPEHPMADTGIRAVALYDYTAGDSDEISFEPDDIISNIDMVDTDWWRGMCRGQYGLFPANYVELCP